MLEDRNFSEEDVNTEQEGETARLLLDGITKRTDAAKTQATQVDSDQKKVAGAPGNAEASKAPPAEVQRSAAINAVAFELLKKYHDPTGTQKDELSKLNADAGKLISEAKKLSDDPGANAGQIIKNYKEALAKKKLLYGEDRDVVASVLNRFASLKQDRSEAAIKYRQGISEMVSLFDRLADLSKGEQSIKYQEEALHIVEMVSPADHVLIAVRHTALAERYGELAKLNKAPDNYQRATRHFHLANDYWLKEAPQSILNNLSLEQSGDDAFKKGNYEEAAVHYSGTLAHLDKEIDNPALLGGILPPNPHGAILHEKIGDAYSSRSANNKTSKNLEMAAQEYEIAKDILKDYSSRYGSGDALLEQFRVTAAAIVIHCKLADKSAQDNDKDHHLTEAARLLKELATAETGLRTTVDVSMKESHYGKYDPCLIPACLNIANNYPKYSSNAGALFTEANRQDTIVLLDRVYAMQTAQGKNIDERISTLQSIVNNYRNLGEREKSFAIESVQKAIKAETTYGKNDPRVLANFEVATSLCSKNLLYRHALALLKKQDIILSTQDNNIDKRADTLMRLSNALYTCGETKQAIESISKALGLIENKYGVADKHLLTFMQTVSDQSDPYSPVHGYIARTLERVYASQKTTEDRTATLLLLSTEYANSSNKKRGVATLERILKLAENDYGKDSPQIMPVLSNIANSFRMFSEDTRSVEMLERLYKLQSAPSAKIDVQKQTETLLRLSELHCEIAGHKEQAIEKLEQAIALAKASYANNSPFYQSFLQKAAKYCVGHNLHEQAASLGKQLYEIQTAQNKSTEERLQTLTSVGQAYFDARDHENAIKTFAQAVQIANKDKTLSRFLIAPPYMRPYVDKINGSVPRDKANLPAEMKSTSNLYSLGGAIKKAADILYTHSFPDYALDNYQLAAECFNKCLTRGIESKPDILIDMLNISEGERKYKNLFNVNENRRTSLEMEVSRIYHNAAESVGKVQNSQDPHLIEVLDKLCSYYASINDSRSALPLLSQAYSLAKTKTMPLEELGKRAIRLANAQADTNQRAAAINTCRQLLKDAQTVAGNKPNRASLLALHEISNHLQFLGSNGIGIQKFKDAQKAHLQEALDFKEQEIAMAKALNMEPTARASLAQEKSLIHLKQGDQEKALASMQEALKLDKNLAQNVQFKEQMNSLLKNTRQSK